MQLQNIIRKIIFASVFLFEFLLANASKYYFSSVSGDDNRTSTMAQNAATPWKTITKLNSIATILKPGDSILFKKGETFYGSIVIQNSGTIKNSITYGTFGNGAKPIITGLSTLSNWVSKGNGVYEKYLSSRLTSSLNMVVFQDSLQPIGRWPKISATNAGYLHFQSHAGISSITSNQLSVAPNFSGGEVVIRAAGWILDRSKVISQTTNTVNYSPLHSALYPASTYQPLDGFGFFFQNHMNALSQLGDWMYDLNTKKIRIYFGTQNPSTFKIKAATIENLVSFKNNSNYLIFDGLSFAGCNAYTFNLYNAANILINNCDINYSGIDGIFGRMSYTNNITIMRCSILNSNNNAITGEGSPNWTIQNNFFKKTGCNSGMGLSGDGQYNAISLVGSNSLVELNDIRNTGYIGIEFEGDYSIVRKNFIDSFCLVKSDGGGIYTSIDSGKTGRKVMSNIILDGIGDRFGRSQAEIDNIYAANVHGIYMDGDAANVEIDSNTVANCGSTGLELSSTFNMSIKNNTFYNNKQAQIFYFRSTSSFSNLTIEHNINFSTTSDQLISIINNTSDDESTWGKIDSNYYCRPSSEPPNIDTAGYSHSPTLIDYPDGGIIQAANGRFYSLDKWITLSGQDAHTQKTPAHPSDLNNIKFIYNASNSQKTFAINGTFFDVKNQFYNNTITLLPYCSAVLIKSTGLSPQITIRSLKDQNITFPSINPKSLGDSSFTLSASASSGLPVSFRILSGPASLSSNMMTLSGIGIISVEAIQEGDLNYKCATPVIQNFNVFPAHVSNNMIFEIKDVANKHSKISIYPNPFRNEAQIQIFPSETGLAKLTLHDINGKVVKTLFEGKLFKNQFKNFKLYAQGLPGELYIISLMEGTKFNSLKISKIK